VHTKGTNEAQLGCIEGRHGSTILAGIPGVRFSRSAAGFTMMHFRGIGLYAGHFHDKVAYAAKLLPHPVAAHIPLPLALLARNNSHGSQVIFGIVFMITNTGGVFKVV
jgi:hypothetical protein